MKHLYAVLFCYFLGSISLFAQSSTDRLDLLTKLKLATHDTARMDLYIQLADLFIVEEGNAEKGINQANLAYLLAHNYDDQKRKYLALDKLIKAHLDLKNDLKTAIDSLTTMKSIDTSYLSIQNQALVFGHEGRLFSNLNDFDKAEKAFSIEEAMYNKIGYTAGIANVNYHLGELFFAQNNFKKALKYFEKSLLAFNRVENPRGKLKTLNALGQTHGKLGDFTKNLAFSSDALLIAHAINDKLELAKININIGFAYQNLERPVDAIGYYNAALEYGEITDDYPIVASTASELGNIYHQLCDEIEAELNFEQSLEFIDKIESKELKKNIYTNVFQFHEEYGRDSLGYLYLKKIAQIKDELYSEEQTRQLVMNQIRYESEKREEEVKQLRARELENSLTIKNQKLQNYTLIGLMLLAIVLTVILYNALRRKRANNQRLEEEVKKRTVELEASNEELKYFNTELERSNNELERFAYIASHDLKSPLRNVISFLSLIKRKLRKHDDSDLEEYLTFASNNAHQMHNLIQDVLEFSRFDRSETSETEVDLNESLMMVMQNLQESMTERNAVVFAQSLPTIQSNSVRIMQLLQNLVSNGIKYNQNPKPRVIVGHRMDKLNHVFSVIDNGIGIDKEYHAQIFEMFKRLHTREEYQGTGIGLALCKKIVDNLGGEIWLESEEGKGTSFFFSIPKYSAN